MISKDSKTKKELTQQVLAFLLCAAMLFGILPISAFAIEEEPLAEPISVSLTDMDGLGFTELTPGEGFNVTYRYGTIENIDSSVKYKLPTLSNHLEVLHGNIEDAVIKIPVTDSTNHPLGILEVDMQSGEMTFQFDESINGMTMDDFFLQFAVKLDDSDDHVGEDIKVSFPIKGGTADFDITVVDTQKDPPKIAKSAALSEDISDSGNVEILWTITVTNTGNPQKNISIHDTWSENQEYVDGSFCMGGVPITTGLTVTEKGFQYERTNINANDVDVITYKTRIKSSAFLKNGISLTSGNIKCTNTAQAFYPNDSNTSLTNSVTATYTHPITWLYKTSGDVIDRTTGEMEWTITIRNNGLYMQNVVLYDRLSPGISIKDDTATIQIGNNPSQTLTDFKRISDEDLTYNSVSGQEYNLVYELGDIGNVAVIKYRTIITDMDTYNAEENLPPNSMFDNRAFIIYQIPSGGGLSSVITSPVIEKSGGYDEGLIGKEGVIEPAYHTIKWTMTVNNDAEELKGVTVTDKLTYAAPVSAVPSKYQLCNHVYDDIERNKPQYTYDGKTFYDFAPYDAVNPNKQFTYRLVPSGTGDVYEIVFYLGDINEKMSIVFRSTATDEIIYANDVTNNNCGYENKATLITDGNAFSYASADVLYKSDVYQKIDARSWYNKTEHSYDFENNRLPWLMRVNINKMEMTDICITDILNEGTSLVSGTMIVGIGTGSWYKLEDDTVNTMAIPEYTDGAAKPYYTYNKETRELKIYLDDITGAVVGTDKATKQIVFYVQLDVNHPIFNDPTYPGYIKNNNGTWTIPNTGSLENNYLSGANAVKEGAAYVTYVQHLLKNGTAYKNGDAYSIDYSLAINRIQKELPEPAVIQDMMPAGLRIDVSTLRLYEATVVSPDLFFVKDDGTNGKLIKGEEVSPQLYSVQTEVADDGITTMRITLPQNSGKKMYIAEYSCDVTDVSKAPFTNNATIEGITQSNVNQTITKIQLTSAVGGGTMKGAEKTTVSVTKKDSASGIPVKGAVFGIYYKGMLIEKKTTDETGKLIFENLNKGYEYTVTEIKSAPGYFDPINVTETFQATSKDNPTSLTFENAPIKGTVQFIKTGENGVALPGAVFGIWENIEDVGNNTPLATASSQKNGVVDFFSLMAGKTYYIAEITAPENYRKSEEIIVAQMGMDGAMEKLWLNSDRTETAITAFQNSQTSSGTLIVSKTVTGNMGERTKAFSFTLNVQASTSLPADSVLNGIKTAADGSKTDVTIKVGKPYLFTLAHGEFLTVNGLQSDIEYVVTEDNYSADGYKTSYSSTRNGTEEQSENGRSVTGTITSGTNTEAFVNDANITTPTGIFLDLLPYVLLMLPAALGGIILLYKKKRHRTMKKAN